MEFRFAKSKLGKLYLSGTGAKRYPANIVRAFIKKVRIIETAKDKRDFWALKSLHFKELKGTEGQYSMRLNQDWRLILRFEKTKDGKVVVIIDINRHYGD